MSEGSNSDPTIEFQTPDGATRRFSEDYILLCGSRRDLCFIRHFAQGQVVPVTYDRVFPERAYVRDWALIANVITFFIEIGLTLMFVLMLIVILTAPDIPVGSGTEGDSYPPM